MTTIWQYLDNMIITGNFNHDYHNNQNIAHPYVHVHVHVHVYVHVALAVILFYLHDTVYQVFLLLLVTSE